MNKTDLTRRLARVTRTSRAEAADYLDQSVLSILKQWKHGQQVAWPGLGVFSKDATIPTIPATRKAAAEDLPE